MPIESCPQMMCGKSAGFLKAARSETWQRSDAGMELTAVQSVTQYGGRPGSTCNRSLCIPASAGPNPRAGGAVRERAEPDLESTMSKTAFEPLFGTLPFGGGWRVVFRATETEGQHFSGGGPFPRSAYPNIPVLDYRAGWPAGFRLPECDGEWVWTPGSQPVPLEQYLEAHRRQGIPVYGPGMAVPERCPLIECEECGQPFEPTDEERRYPPISRTRCDACACPVCHDQPYSYVHGDREIGAECCPSCGRGDADDLWSET
jgi:hypothetical protein